MHRQYPVTPVPAVAAVIIADGQVLLAKRGNPPRAGSWSIPGGKLELGESLQDATHREVREETGLEITDLRLLDVGDIVVHDTDDQIQYHYVIVYYAARLDGGTLRPGDDASATLWIAPDQAETLAVSPRLLELIRQAQTLAQQPESAPSE